MLLLPDQTYEQCQDLLAPLMTLKSLLNGTAFHSKTKGVANGIGARSQRDQVKQTSFEYEHEIYDSDDSDDDSLLGTSESGSTRVHTPEIFERTSEFFNNIPDFNGEPLGPFSIPNSRETSRTTADLLKECEMFLYKYRIRPDFFCRYRRAME